MVFSLLPIPGAIAGNISSVDDNITVTQQQKKISGVVKDKDGVPVIGANILVKGTTNGTITDMDGRFSLDIPNNAILQVSYIGYKTQEIVVGNQTSLNIRLREDTEALDEVVVVAYGTQKARSVTGAVSRLKEEEMADIPVANISYKMQGKFSGVQITQANGEPNAGMAIRIRGAASVNGGNSPLIVVDGFPISGNGGTGLESMAPEEIENITVLKDAASAALYGSRAANGVILVTTKSAKEGKTDVDFSAYFGATQVSKRGRPDLMNAQEFAQFKKEYYEDAAIYEGYTGGVPECYQHPETLGEGTDWYDVLLQTALTQNYNLGINSGTTKVKSAINLNYNKQEGVILNTFSERFSVRANNTYEASNRVKFGLNLSGSYTNGRLVPGLGGGRNIIGSSFLLDPQLKYKNDDGTYPISFSQPGMFANPNFYVVLTERDDNKRVMRGIVNAFAEIGIIDNLKYRLSANADLSSTQSDSWVPSIANGAMFTAPPNPATGSYGTERSINWLIENTLTWNKTFAEKHNVDLLVGYTTQKTETQNATISASNYPDDEVPWFNAATTKTGSGSKSAWAMISYLARANYDYMGKYLLSVSFRRDGCSRFGANAKFANFPSVSVGWIASDEDFMQRFDKLSYLKVRGSYGVVGNYNIGDYNHLATVGTSNYVFNGSITAGRALSRIGNSELTWETTKSVDAGLDIGLFNDRVFLVYDYYWKTTDGLLYQIDIPYSAGFGDIQSNIGEFRFWGHELNIETRNLTGEFKWNTSLNLSFNKNKAIKLGTNNTPIGGNNNQEDYNRTEVGKPLGLFYGYVYDGVFMTQEEYEAGPKHASSMVGTVRMKDLNGDGIIDNSDRTFIGDPNPDCLFGMTNTFSWKNFDASLVFTGSIPRTRTGTTELFRYTNSRWVFKNNYLTLKNITVGYTVPIKKNPYIKGIRIYGSAQNVFTVGSYPGMNPEANKNTSGLYQGVDHTTYPVARIYTIGLNVKF